MFVLTVDNVRVHVSDHVWKRSDTLRGCMDLEPDEYIEDVPAFMATLPLDAYVPVRVHFYTIQWLQAFVHFFHKEYPFQWTSEQEDSLTLKASQVEFAKSAIYKFIANSVQSKSPSGRSHLDMVDINRLNLLLNETDFLLAGFAHYCLVRYQYSLAIANNGNLQDYKRLLCI